MSPWKARRGLQSFLLVTAIAEKNGKILFKISHDLVSSSPIRKITQPPSMLIPQLIPDCLFSTREVWARVAIDGTVTENDLFGGRF